MQGMASREFIHFAKENGFFDDIVFLDYFKDRGQDFWYNVICLSKIDMNFLFERFEEEMTNPRLYKRMKESGSNTFMNFRVFTRFKDYFKEYEKRRKINVWIKVK